MASVTIEASLQPSISIVEWLFVAVGYNCHKLHKTPRVRRRPESFKLHASNSNSPTMLGKTLKTLQLTLFTLSSDIHDNGRIHSAKPLSVDKGFFLYITAP